MAGTLSFVRSSPFQSSYRSSPSLRSLFRISAPVSRLPSQRRFSAISSEEISSDHASSLLVLEDDRYAKKKLISLTPSLYDYLISNVREEPILRELREETSRLSGSQLQVSPEVGQLLSMLVQILGAQNCIEVGVYTGYSSLAVALALPQNGRLVACERDAKCLDVAKRYYERASVSHKVDVRHGIAIDTLKSMIENGEACSYDFAFLDADKKSYDQYFQVLLELVRVGGIIVIDNVLWKGKVADPMVNDQTTVTMRNFNNKIFNDKRVNISMVPIGDGITICRKILR